MPLRVESIMRCSMSPTRFDHDADHHHHRPCHDGHHPDEAEGITLRVTNAEPSHIEFKLKARSSVAAELVARPARGVLPSGRSVTITLTSKAVAEPHAAADDDGAGGSNAHRHHHHAGAVAAVAGAHPVLCSRPIDGVAWDQQPIHVPSPAPSPDATDPRAARPTAADTAAMPAAVSSRAPLQSSIAATGRLSKDTVPGSRMQSSAQQRPRHTDPAEVEHTLSPAIYQRFQDYESLVQSLLAYVADGCRAKRAGRTATGPVVPRLLQVIVPGMSSIDAARKAVSGGISGSATLRLSKDGQAPFDDVKLRNVSTIVLGRHMKSGNTGTDAAAATGGDQNAAGLQRTIALEDSTGTTLMHVRLMTWDDFEAVIAVLFLLRGPSCEFTWHAAIQPGNHRQHAQQAPSSTAARTNSVGAAAKTGKKQPTRASGAAAEQKTKKPAFGRSTPRGEGPTTAPTSAKQSGATTSSKTVTSPQPITPMTEEMLIARYGIDTTKYSAAKATIAGLAAGRVVSPLELIERHELSLFHALAVVELMSRFPAAAPTTAGSGPAPAEAALRVLPLAVRA